MEIAVAVISPVVQIAGKLMKYASKFQVNGDTLKELRVILEELKSKVDEMWITKCQ